MKTALIAAVLALAFTVAPGSRALAANPPPPPPPTDVVPPAGDITDEEWYEEWFAFLRLLYTILGGNPNDLDLPAPPSPQP